MPDESVFDVTKRDRFELVSAYLDGEVTPAERLLVANWLAHDPEVQRLYRRLLLLRQAFRTMPSELSTVLPRRGSQHEPIGAAVPADLSSLSQTTQPPAHLQADGALPVQLSPWQRRRFRTASLALVFTATTLFVTSLTGLISGGVSQRQLTQLELPNRQPTLGGPSQAVPELALDEPAIDLPTVNDSVSNDAIEDAVH